MLHDAYNAANFQSKLKQAVNVKNSWSRMQSACKFIGRSIDCTQTHITKKKSKMRNLQRKLAVA